MFTKLLNFFGVKTEQQKKDEYNAAAARCPFLNEQPKENKTEPVTEAQKVEPVKEEKISINLTSDTISFPAASTVTIADSSPSVITTAPAPKTGGKGRPKNTKPTAAKPANPRGARKKK